jgi:hypothetical protein
MNFATPARKITLVLVAIVLVAIFGVLLFETFNARATPEEIQIWVEGPWAYADDTRPGQTGIVLVAPNPDAIHHTAPAIGHHNGDYEFSSGSVLRDFPKRRPIKQASTANPQRINFSNQNLANFLSRVATDRHILFLPKPDWYEESAIAMAKLRSTWWSKCFPDCGSEVPHTNQMILHYGVSSLPDTFEVKSSDEDKRLFFRDRNVITIFMTAEGRIDPCDSDARLAFHRLVGLFSATLYIDLRDTTNKYPSDDPNDTEGCLANDPQNPDNNDPNMPNLRITRSLSGALHDLQSYILTPKKEDADRARANWNQVRRANKFFGPTEGDKRKEFDDNMAIVDGYLTDLEGDRKFSVTPTKALVALVNAGKSIPFHNGSGACRNPLIELTPEAPQ